jgi:cell division protein FtsI/penicillin-binding protein 2
MLDACSSGGTGFPFFIYNSQVRNRELNAYDEIENGSVACKTGTSEFGSADSRGYRKTHGWFVASFGTKQLVDKLKSKYLLENNPTAVGGETESVATGDTGEKIATKSAENNENLQKETNANLQNKTGKEIWVDKIAQYGFPEKLTVVVLVESDEVNPYREGSKDAGPVAKEIFDWMFGDVVGSIENLDEIPEYSRE